MKLHPVIFILLPVLAGYAASRQTNMEAGQFYYEHAEFKKAMAVFQRALATDPENADLNYWAGISCQRLADIAMPFGGRYNSRAGAYLTKAANLAPGRTDYRRALFDFLLDSARSSRRSLRLAADILQNTPEADPEYGSMLRRFERECEMSSSPSATLDRLFLGIPRKAFAVAALPW